MEASKPNGTKMVTRTDSNGSLRTTENVRMTVPGVSHVDPLSARDVMDVVHKSCGTFQNIVGDIKEIIRGVEADLRASEIINITEEPNKRSVTVRRQYRIAKDR